MHSNQLSYSPGNAKITGGHRRASHRSPAAQNFPVFSETVRSVDWHCLIGRLKTMLIMKYDGVDLRPIPAFLVFIALTLGFAIADLTDIRWLGGMIMISIGAFAVILMIRTSGVLRALIGVVMVVVGFMLSHALGPMLGSYGALILVATACSVVVYLLTSRQGSNQR